jgi:hypothetical protein
MDSLLDCGNAYIVLVFGLAHVFRAAVQAQPQASAHCQQVKTVAVKIMPGSSCLQRATQGTEVL